MKQKQTRFFWIAIGLALFTGCQHGGMSSRFSQEPRHFTDREARIYLKDHGLVRIPRSDMPLEVNDRVVAWVDYFSGVQRDRFQRYLDRSARYIELMRPILKEEGVPEDLVYLPLIESGFATMARSRAHAVGPWQFMRATGRLYGLKQNNWVDERCNPEKSTRAAARYFKKMHREFGDWYLALAGYNSGEGRVWGAIKRGGTTNYWDLTAPDSSLFRTETKDYVPKYLAAMIIAKMPEKFGFTPPDTLQQKMQYDRVAVKGSVSLKAVARLTKTDEEEIQLLNSELVRSVTPPGGYELRIPVGQKESFLVAYASMPKEKIRFGEDSHKVRRGETLGKIAGIYHVRTDDLMEINHIRNARGLRVGAVLAIPSGGVAPKAAKTVVAENQTPQRSQDRNAEKYKVRSGDSLWSIADKYGVTVAELKHWNRIRNHHSLRPGTQLVVYAKDRPILASATDVVPQSPSAGVVPPVVRLTAPVVQETEERVDSVVEGVYVVQSGDTLWDIAQKKNVSIRDIKKFNKLGSNVVRPGDTLRLK